MRERGTFVSIATPGLFTWLLKLRTGVLVSARKDTKTQGVCVCESDVEIWKAGYILTKGALRENGIPFWRGLDALRGETLYGRDAT